jgi:hypothetical protein
LTIEGKWLQTIDKVLIFEFGLSKTSSTFVSIHVCCKFQLSRTTLVGFEKDIQQFIPKIKRNLNVEGLIAPFAISYNNSV